VSGTGYDGTVAVDVDRVMEAVRDWVWVPVDASDVSTSELRVIAYPGWWSVQWSCTDRLDALVEETVAHARAAGADRLVWWVRPGTEPADTAHRLLARGFGPGETLDVLALEVTAESLAGIGAPTGGDVVVRTATDGPSLRLAGEIAAEVFDEPPPTPAQLAESAAQLADRPWRYRRWVVSVDGAPAGSAGATRTGDVVRLWGGAVRSAARGRGAYRALLAARCEAALVAGASSVIVQGRVETSAPILRRAGFQVCGQVVGFELRLDPSPPG